MIPSPFTDRENIIAEDQLSFAWVNQFPATPGHVLIVPKRPVVSAFDLTKKEVVSHMSLAARVVKGLESHYHPNGYNFAWNDGEAAGQTVAQAHMHIMPCYQHINRSTGIADRRGGFLWMDFMADTMPDYYKHHSIEETDNLDVLKKRGRTRVLAPSVSAKAGHFLVMHKDLTKTKPFEDPDASAAQFVTARKFKENFRRKADGFNLGWNIGPSAGQFHDARVLDVLPRSKSDTHNPRGGVVTMFPKLPEYYALENADHEVEVKTRITLEFKGA